jgi:hypothetical protein
MIDVTASGYIDDETRIMHETVRTAVLEYNDSVPVEDGEYRVVFTDEILALTRREGDAFVDVAEFMIARMA